MICCVLLSCIIVLPIALLLKRKNTALEWRKGDVVQPSYSSARIRSFKYALAGLRSVLKTEANARIHVAVAGCAMVLGVVMHINAQDWALLALAIALVWITETINTAIEYLCDVVSPEKREAVRHAKDIAAGAVLLAAICAVVVGGVVFLA